MQILKNTILKKSFQKCLTRIHHFENMLWRFRILFGSFMSLEINGENNCNVTKMDNDFLTLEIVCQEKKVFIEKEKKAKNGCLDSKLR